MRNKTELMENILQSEMAQKIIDYITPKYGASYVGLWLLEVIGGAMGEVDGFARKLKRETNPGTAELLLDLWEKHYALPQDSTLTKEQRQRNLVNKVQTRAPFNPAKMEQILSNALGGAKVEITENVGKNTFSVMFQGGGLSTEPAISLIEKMKPAHLQWKLIISYRFSIGIGAQIASYLYDYELCGTKPEPAIIGEITTIACAAEGRRAHYLADYRKVAEDGEYAGESRKPVFRSLQQEGQTTVAAVTGFMVDYPYCGTRYSQN